MMESKLEAVMALTALLQGPFDEGNRVLGKEGVLEIILAMADSNDAIHTVSTWNYSKWRFWQTKTNILNQRLRTTDSYNIHFFEMTDDSFTQIMSTKMYIDNRTI